MKKIFIAALSLVALVSCGGGNQMYFDNEQLRSYNDPNGEFDTLSYAVGMNVGLGLEIQNAHLDLQSDVVIATINEELAKSVPDYDLVMENNELMSRFSTECSRPYQMAKRSQAFIKTDRPDTLTLPEIYNEEFTPEKVSKMFGRDVANYVRRLAFPLNTYWMFKAMEDAATVESPNQIDSLMSIPGAMVRKVMSAYVAEDWTKYNLERTTTWLENVAKHNGVNAMEVEGNTLYYRVDVAGGELHPQNMCDTVAFSYEVYTRSGFPVESTAKRLEDMRKMLEETKTKMLFTDSVARQQRIDKIEEQIRKTENLRIPLSNSMITGAQYALKNVGKGGEITIWMPAALAYGERGNRVVGPNDGIVMHIKLHDVVTVDPEAIPAVAPMKPERPTKQVLQPGESKITVLPANRPAKKAPEGKPIVIPVKQ